MRFSLRILLLTTTFAVRVVNAQTIAEIPTCQWGNCVTRCEGLCPPGSVCGIEGYCVQVKKDPEQAAAEKEQEDRGAVERRHQARAQPRFVLGVGLGSGEIEGNLATSVYAVELGYRRQLSRVTGLSLHAGAAYGIFTLPRDPQADSEIDSSYSEFWIDVVPYFGPFGRFYVGPALVLGYRHYSDGRLVDGAQTYAYQDRTLLEVGARLGVLFGNREQYDLWLQGCSSFDSVTPGQVLLGFNFEFM